MGAEFVGSAAAAPADALLVTDLEIDLAYASVAEAVDGALRALEAVRGPVLVLGPPTPHTFEEPYLTAARAAKLSQELRTRLPPSAAFLDVAAMTASRKDGLAPTGISYVAEVARALAEATTPAGGCRA